MCGMSQRQTAKSAKSRLCPPWAPYLVSRSFRPWTTHLDKEIIQRCEKHVTRNGTAFKHSLTQIDR